MTPLKQEPLKYQPAKPATVSYKTSPDILGPPKAEPNKLEPTQSPPLKKFAQPEPSKRETGTSRQSPFVAKEEAPQAANQPEVALTIRQLNQPENIIELAFKPNVAIRYVLRTLSRHVRRPQILQSGKLVEKDGSGNYSSVADDEFLGPRVELYLMNATMSMNTSNVDITDDDYKEAERVRSGRGPSAKPAQAKVEESNEIQINIRELHMGSNVNLMVPKKAQTAEVKQL